MKLKYTYLLAFATLLLSACSIAMDFGATYERVTSVPSDGKWDGEYLLVCESDTLFWDGSATPLKLASARKTNVPPVYSSKKREVRIDAGYGFVVSTLSDGKVSIRSASGYYVGAANGATPSLSKSTQYSNVLELRDGEIVIANAAGEVIGYDSDSKMFKFSEDTTKALHLYRRTDSNDKD